MVNIGTLIFLLNACAYNPTSIHSHVDELYELNGDTTKIKTVTKMVCGELLMDANEIGIEVVFNPKGGQLL